MRFGLHQSRLAQQAVIAAGQHAPLLVPVVQVLQLHPQHRRLHGVQPAVPANLFVVVAATASMIAQPANMVGNAGIIGGDAAAIAVGAQILCGIEAEARRFPQRAAFFAFHAAPKACAASSTMGACSVCQLGEASMSAHCPYKMDGHHGPKLCLRPRFSAFSTCGGEIQRGRDQYRPAPALRRSARWR